MRPLATCLTALLFQCAACAPKTEDINASDKEPADQARASNTPVETKRRVVEFGPGLRIDYRVPQVEIDGEVILREGPLELFAYAKAPQHKEHESIVLLQSKPQRIYQALGLIGLTPGQTTRYFPETRRIRLPTGDPVDVLVRYEAKGVQTTVSACDWMLDAEAGAPMSPRTWLFTGSERYDDGTFCADIDGTVVTVVDFPSSVLGLAGRHSDSDADLWLKANTKAIPPDGTPVTLILRPAPKTLEVSLGKDDAVSIAGEAVERVVLAETVKDRTAGWTDRASVIIRALESTSPQTVSQATSDLIEAGIGHDRIKLKMVQDSASDSAAAPSQ